MIHNSIGMDISSAEFFLKKYLMLDGTLHKKARTEKPAIYPERIKVPDSKVPWEVSFLSYNSKYFVAPKVLEEDRTKKDGGTPVTVGHMLNSMAAGMGLAQSVEGFREAAFGETLEALGQGMSQLTALVGGVASHFGIKPENLLPTGKAKSEKNERDGALANSAN